MEVGLHETTWGDPLGWRLWFMERRWGGDKPQSGCKQSYRFWCEDVLIEAGSSVASDNLPVVRMHWGPCTSPALTKRASAGWSLAALPLLRGFPPLRAGQKQAAEAQEGGWGTITASALGGACNSYVPINICHYSRHPDCSCRNLNPGYILACERQPQYPAYTEGRAQTCQVKKGMSPSCKHFLSGREHFLNPGATKPFLIFPPNNCR